MKKLLLPLIFLCLTTTTFGQILITNSDLAPVGTSVFLAYDTLPGPAIVPGESGADRTWDFTNLNVHQLDTFRMVLPAATPYASEYPNANFASISRESDTTAVFSYMIRNDDRLSSTGTAIQGGDEALLLMHNEPDEILLDFPVSYGDSYNENYITNIIMESPEPGADSVWLKTDVEKTTHVDAWGSLTIPLGTYNVLRQRVDELRYDSIFVMIFGNWMFISASQDSATYYSWWTNNTSIGFNLVAMDVDYSSGEVGGVTFMHNTPVGLIHNNKLEANFFPNPFKDILNIEFLTEYNGNLILADQTARIILTKRINGQDHLQLNLSELPVGLYLYYLKSISGKTLGSAKLLKQ